jgi:hypothetical protein
VRGVPARVRAVLARVRAVPARVRAVLARLRAVLGPGVSLAAQITARPPILAVHMPKGISYLRLERPAHLRRGAFLSVPGWAAANAVAVARAVRLRTGQPRRARPRAGKRACPTSRAA